MHDPHWQSEGQAQEPDEDDDDLAEELAGDTAQRVEDGAVPGGNAYESWGCALSVERVHTDTFQ